MKLFTTSVPSGQQQTARRFSAALEIVLGVAVFAVLYFVLFYDLSRIPQSWQAALLEEPGREPGMKKPYREDRL